MHTHKRVYCLNQTPKNGILSETNLEDIIFLRFIIFKLKKKKRRIAHTIIR